MVVQTRRARQQQHSCQAGGAETAAQGSTPGADASDSAGADPQQAGAQQDEGDGHQEPDSDLQPVEQLEAAAVAALGPQRLHDLLESVMRAELCADLVLLRELITAWVDRLAPSERNKWLFVWPEVYDELAATCGDLGPGNEAGSSNTKAGYQVQQVLMDALLTAAVGGQVDWLPDSDGSPPARPLPENIVFIIRWPLPPRQQQQQQQVPGSPQQQTSQQQQQQQQQQQPAAGAGGHSPCDAHLCMVLLHHGAALGYTALSLNTNSRRMKAPEGHKTCLLHLEPHSHRHGGCTLQGKKHCRAELPGVNSELVFAPILAYLQRRIRVAAERDRKGAGPPTKAARVGLLSGPYLEYRSVQLPPLPASCSQGGTCSCGPALLVLLEWMLAWPLNTHLLRLRAPQVSLTSGAMVGLAETPRKHRELLYSSAWYPPAYVTLMQAQLKRAAQRIMNLQQQQQQQPGPQQPSSPAGQQVCPHSLRQLAQMLVQQLADPTQHTRGNWCYPGHSGHLQLCAKRAAVSPHHSTLFHGLLPGWDRERVQALCADAAASCALTRSTQQQQQQQQGDQVDALWRLACKDATMVRTRDQDWRDAVRPWAVVVMHQVAAAAGKPRGLLAAVERGLSCQPSSAVAAAVAWAQNRSSGPRGNGGAAGGGGGAAGAAGGGDGGTAGGGGIGGEAPAGEGPPSGLGAAAAGGPAAASGNAADDLSPASAAADDDLSPAGAAADDMSPAGAAADDMSPADAAADAQGLARGGGCGGGGATGQLCSTEHHQVLSTERAGAAAGCDCTAAVDGQPMQSSQQELLQRELDDALCHQNCDWQQQGPQDEGQQAAGLAEPAAEQQQQGPPLPLPSVLQPVTNTGVPQVCPRSGVTHLSSRSPINKHCTASGVVLPVTERPHQRVSLKRKEPAAAAAAALLPTADTEQPTGAPGAGSAAHVAAAAAAAAPPAPPAAKRLRPTSTAAAGASPDGVGRASGSSAVLAAAAAAAATGEPNGTRLYGRTSSPSTHAAAAAAEAGAVRPGSIPGVHEQAAVGVVAADCGGRDAEADPAAAAAAAMSDPDSGAYVDVLSSEAATPTAAARNSPAAESGWAEYTPPAHPLLAQKQQQPHDDDPLLQHSASKPHLSDRQRRELKLGKDRDAWMHQRYMDRKDLAALELQHMTRQDWHDRTRAAAKRQAQAALSPGVRSGRPPPDNGEDDEDSDSGSAQVGARQGPGLGFGGYRQLQKELVQQTKQKYTQQLFKPRQLSAKQTQKQQRQAVEASHRQPQPALERVPKPAHQLGLAARKALLLAVAAPTTAGAVGAAGAARRPLALKKVPSIKQQGAHLPHQRRLMVSTKQQQQSAAQPQQQEQRRRRPAAQQLHQQAAAKQQQQHQQRPAAQQHQQHQQQPAVQAHQLVDTAVCAKQQQHTPQQLQANVDSAAAAAPDSADHHAAACDGCIAPAGAAAAVAAVCAVAATCAPAPAQPSCTRGEQQGVLAGHPQQHSGPQLTAAAAAYSHGRPPAGVAAAAGQVEEAGKADMPLQPAAESPLAAATGGAAGSVAAADGPSLGMVGGAAEPQQTAHAAAEPEQLQQHPQQRTTSKKRVRSPSSTHGHGPAAVGLSEAAAADTAAVAAGGTKLLGQQTSQEHQQRPVKRHKQQHKTPQLPPTNDATRVASNAAGEGENTQGRAASTKMAAAAAATGQRALLQGSTPAAAQAAGRADPVPSPRTATALHGTAETSKQQQLLSRQGTTLPLPPQQTPCTSMQQNMPAEVEAQERHVIQQHQQPHPQQQQQQLLSKRQRRRRAALQASGADPAAERCTSSDSPLNNSKGATGTRRQGATRSEKAALSEKAAAPAVEGSDLQQQQQQQPLSKRQRRRMAALQASGADPAVERCTSRDSPLNNSKGATCTRREGATRSDKTAAATPTVEGGDLQQQRQPGSILPCSRLCNTSAHVAQGHGRSGSSLPAVLPTVPMSKNARRRLARGYSSQQQQRAVLVQQQEQPGTQAGETLQQQQQQQLALQQQKQQQQTTATCRSGLMSTQQQSVQQVKAQLAGLPQDELQQLLRDGTSSSGIGYGNIDRHALLSAACQELHRRRLLQQVSEGRQVEAAPGGGQVRQQDSRYRLVLRAATQQQVPAQQQQQQPAQGGTSHNSQRVMTTQEQAVQQHRLQLSHLSVEQLQELLLTQGSGAGAASSGPCLLVAACQELRVRRLAQLQERTGGKSREQRRRAWRRKLLRLLRRQKLRNLLAPHKQQQV